MLYGHFDDWNESKSKKNKANETYWNGLPLPSKTSSGFGLWMAPGGRVECFLPTARDEEDCERSLPLGSPPPVDPSNVAEALNPDAVGEELFLHPNRNCRSCVPGKLIGRTIVILAKLTLPCRLLVAADVDGVAAVLPPVPFIPLLIQILA
jgi:hypothetical protein